MEEVVCLIEQIARKGVFGASELIKVIDQSKDVGAHFQSQVLFFRLLLKSIDGREENLPIFVKVQVEPVELSVNYISEQFLTEVTMYETVLPDLGASQMCPKMYYGVATGGANVKEDIIVLEDLRSSGYSVVKNVFLGNEHVVVAMTKLGALHGLSYKMKREAPEKLWSYKLSCKRPLDCNTGGYLAVYLRKGFKYFLDNHPEDEIIKKAFSKISSGDLNRMWENMRKPEEPFAVIIHGDYTKNNVLYKYDSGKVVDLKMIDFGTSVYSDPAVDITTFLYLHTMSDFWDASWDAALAAYWNGVTSITEPGFTFDEFLRNFAKRAIWGYIPCSFYKPFMMFPDAAAGGDFENLSDEEKGQWMVQLGGDEGTQALTDIVSHLLKRGYLEAFANNFEM